MEGKVCPPMSGGWLRHWGTAEAAKGAKGWPQWRDHFQFYLKVTKKDQEEGPTQAAILLTAMGKEAVSVFKTFSYHGLTLRTKTCMVRSVLVVACRQRSCPINNWRRNSLLGNC